MEQPLAFTQLLEDFFKRLVADEAYARQDATEKDQEDDNSSINASAHDHGKANPEGNAA